MLDKELIEILACPTCKGGVEERDGAIVCKNCKRRYPIKDGIPVMLIDESQSE